MKLAKVIPIYKAKSKESFTNYRPISLLASISKILEKVMHKRVYSFLEKHKILSDKQYGFRPKCSTTDAITEFVSDILPSLDRKEYCLSVFLDLSKAFDTINHSILLSKLSHYGIRGKALEWFRSYLDHRRQYVNYCGNKSTTQYIEYGVPQGSVLGPLLFIIYANDIPSSLRHCKAILFADDTTVYRTGQDLDDLYTTVNSDLSQLTDWFRANQLSVNPSKTKSILFSKQKHVDLMNRSLVIDKEKLECVTNTKFLGIFIDEHMTWEYHIKHCQKKISSGVYAINISKHVLAETHLKTLYYSLIHPYLIYGIRLWGNTLQKYIKTLEVSQKRAIRAITGAKYNEPSSPLYKRLNILRISDICKLQLCQFMYDYVHQDLPSSLLQIYSLQCEIHNHNTRHSDDPRPPRASTDTMKRSLLYRAPTIWMELDIGIKNSKTKRTLTRKFSREIIDSY